VGATATPADAGSCRRLIHLRLCFRRGLRRRQLALLTVFADALFNWQIVSSCLAGLRHLSRADVSEIDAEVRAALTEIGEA
jgi:hypothetical protein